MAERGQPRPAAADKARRRANGVQVPGGPLIPESELRWRYSASGGPGGQHVNTSNTRAEVLFDVGASNVLDDRQRQLVIDRLGEVVRVVASDERSQWRNRRLAAERLGDRIADALEIPPERRPTRPSRRALARRRETRLQQQAKRSSRRWTYDEDE
ncbi:MAG TPA: aminoacyl-tRNA hydrolase [Acidimicrobiales bacterium]|nr:aminoacyl-tRNA hydrolase [Acidimicrobiales bacterium]